MRILYLPFFLLLFQSPFLTGQSREQLQNKRQRLLKEIGKDNELLALNKKDRTVTLDQYYALQRQIRQRQDLVKTLQTEIKLAEKSIARTSHTIQALQEDMDRLEKEYSQMIRQAFRNKMNDDQLLFLFSAKGLADGLKRWTYLKQYEEYRKKQADLILETKMALAEKLSSIESRKKDQEQLLSDAGIQQARLEKELIQNNSILQSLKADERKITKQLNQKKKAHQQLNLTIERIIAREIKERNKVNAALSDNTDARKKTTGVVTFTGNFQKEKGKLAWPVRKGIVVRHFGKQIHPIHKQVTITNNGIDIRATGNNKVSSIHEGLVAGVQFVPGFKNTLIVQHGNFYSVYSNLESVTVKKGEKVVKGQTLGMAGKSQSNDGQEMHLEIWKGKQRLNPLHWLSAEN